MDVWDVAFPALTRVPVRFEWKRVPAERALWQGRAHADEPIVGLGLAVHRGELLWHKTLERGAWADDVPGLHVGLWISHAPGDALAGPATVQFQMPGLAPAYTIMTGRAAPFALRDEWSGHSGVTIRLLEIGGDDPLELGVVFVCARDTTRTRKGSWRLRRDLAAVPAPWHLILPGARRGRFAI